MPDPVVIVDYDPAWPAAFAAEKARLLAAIAPWVAAFEHMGSTAVPGLAAKPVIDMMIGLRGLEDAPPCIERLTALGYEYMPQFEDLMPERRYFRRFVEGVRTHQIHMVEVDTPFWARHLAFRDHLIGHEDARDRYGALKRDLAIRYAGDRGAYTDAKTDFIRGIEALALMKQSSY